MNIHSTPNDSSAGAGLEEQIRKLVSLGIGFSLPEEELIEQLTRHWERELYEEEPYVLLLNIAGLEQFERGRGLYRLSPQIWTFDIECVEEEDVYEQAVETMVAMTGGRIEIEELSGKVDFDAAGTEISFTLNGKKHELYARLQGDWFDLDILGGAATIFRGPDLRFLERRVDQSVTFVCCTPAAQLELKQLTNGAFEEPI
ncbi:hypothetical protein QWJ34_12180 [Saccharibacillus sp. CPCC 101409]|uniref:hypothetical protein n=1 Tax=Saccharibacillus sp. CPCC 101409 TaxID=3058041 RepID=UPI002671F03E|nr:hypothetical protein [Saccharibacillus sp. CPCC 101409]MDO3410520.1 hypothetical protein [Saccharibacillus sp. CPCC 101409]